MSPREEGEARARDLIGLHGNKAYDVALAQCGDLARRGDHAGASAMIEIVLAIRRALNMNDDGNLG